MAEEEVVSICVCVCVICHGFPLTTLVHSLSIIGRKMKVNTLFKPKSMGILYKIMYVLSKLYILPLHIDNKNDENIKVEFSFFSLNSLVNAVIFSASSVVTISWILSNHFYYEEYFTKAFNLVYAPSDVWIMVCFIGFCSTSPLFLIMWLIAYIWSKMKVVTRDPTIPFPKAYLSFFGVVFFEICAYIFIFLGNYLATYPFMEKYSSYENFLNIFVVPLIPSVVNISNQPIMAMMCFTLIERIAYLMQNVQSLEEDIMKKVEMFREFQKLMNLPVFALVCSSQIMWIDTMFFSFGLFVGDNKLETIPLVLSMMGYLFYSLAFLVFLKEVFFKMHDLNDSRVFLKEAVEDLDNIDDKRRRFLLREVERLKPVSGYGLFSVERSTLTSMVSVAITYLIILIQFKMAVS